MWRVSASAWPDAPHLVGPALLVLALAGCATYPTPTVAARPVSLPTRVERITPTAVATPAAPTPSPPTARPAYTPADVDPYAALYVSEREGTYVTTRRSDGRYYYRSDDRRWYGVADRVWFRNVEDLKTVFPNRVPAP